MIAITTAEAITGTIHTDIMIAIPDTITGIMIVIINMGGKAAQIQYMIPKNRPKALHTDSVISCFIQMHRRKTQDDFLVSQERAWIAS